ncbi:MAG TPA: DUF5074 domain-containing protein [Chitinophagaceae bacterium]|nr:DUF5074 domain-containing protein [Chitinophagaceae bacterium]
MKPKLHILILMSFLFACVKDKPHPYLSQNIDLNNHGILILNEGAYGNNNAEISYLDLKNNQIQNGIFKTQNKLPLGDVAQSITLINGQYFIGVNNSNKVVVIDTQQHKIIQTIQNIPYPRYIVQSSINTAFISSIYQSSIYVLDLNSYQIIDTIHTDFPNNENMLFDGQNIWACNWDTACNYIYKIDQNTFQITERISINQAKAPHSILQDKDGNLWVLSGDKYKNCNSFLTQYSIQNKQILRQIPFKKTAEPIKLTINDSKDSLYFIQVDYYATNQDNGIYRMRIDDNQIPDKAFIEAPTNTYFWGLGIHPISKNLFISDPKGFTQSSTIYEYSNKGELLNTFQAGIGSNMFLFK